MQRLILLMMLATMLGLSGCATDGTSDPGPVRVQDVGGMNASQSSARNIAPITSYINTSY